MPVKTATLCTKVSITFWMAAEDKNNELLRPLRLTSNRLITDQLMQESRDPVREIAHEHMMSALFRIVKGWLDAGMAPAAGKDIKDLTIPINTIHLLRVTRKEREIEL